VATKPHSDAALLDAFDRIRVWQKGGQRAVHKPLLVLLALGRLWRGEQPKAEFSAIEESLRNLLNQFGPSSAAASRHYPFWHLRTDGLWILQGPKAILDRPPSATPTLAELREEHVTGSFAPAILEVLERERSLIPRIARRIVEAHFPDSLQQDVLNAVGIDAAETGSESSTSAAGNRPRRDPSFRNRVLLAYEQRCCICGHDLRLEGMIVGLEAAHIKWFQAGGPDIEPNGLALCSLHHKLFDLGVFTLIKDKHTIVVSQHVTGGEDTRARMLSYHGAGLIRPQSDSCLPRPEFLDWHKIQVFKKPARELE
jgi:putative restriction endonuclease